MAGGGGVQPKECVPLPPVAAGLEPNKAAAWRPAGRPQHLLLFPPRPWEPRAQGGLRSPRGHKRAGLGWAAGGGGGGTGLGLEEALRRFDEETLGSGCRYLARGRGGAEDEAGTWPRQARLFADQAGGGGW